MYEHQLLITELQNKYTDATNAQKNSKVIRALRGRDFNLFTCLHSAVEQVSDVFFNNLTFILAEIEKATHENEDALKARINALDIHSQIRCNQGRCLEELERTSGNAQRALMEYSPEMDALGLHDALRHYENMKNVILSVTAHLRELKTEGLNKKTALKTLKTQEYKHLYEFIKQTFADEMAVRPCQAIVDITDQVEMRP